MSLITTNNNQFLYCSLQGSKSVFKVFFRSIPLVGICKSDFDNFAPSTDGINQKQGKDLVVYNYSQLKSGQDSEDYEETGVLKCIGGFFHKTSRQSHFVYYHPVMKYCIILPDVSFISCFDESEDLVHKNVFVVGKIICNGDTMAQSSLSEPISKTIHTTVFDNLTGKLEQIMVGDKGGGFDSNNCTMTVQVCQETTFQKAHTPMLWLNLGTVNKLPGMTPNLMYAIDVGQYRFTPITKTNEPLVVGVFLAR